MSFQNCSEVVVRSQAINHVEGNQVNQTISAQVVHINSQGETERTEYDQFKTVIRGDTVTLERLHTEDLSERWELKDGELVKLTGPSTQRTVCTVEVHQRKYTAAIYEGDDAEMFWKEDFERFSRAGLGNDRIWQLYGLNRSKIPFLIFHGELVPLAHVYKKSFWGELFVVWLKNQLECYSSQIWLNTQGNLCKGLDGPFVDTQSASVSSNIIVPSSAQFLQSDIFQYFLQFSSIVEKIILDHARRQYELIYLDKLLPKLAEHHTPSDHTNSYSTKEYPYLNLFQEWPDHLPLDVITGLRFDTIYSPSRGAVASWPRDNCSFWETYGSGLVDKTKMGNGLIRFELDESGDVDIDIEPFQEDNCQKSWLAQSSRIIDAHNMSGTEEEQYFTVQPPFYLNLRTLLHSKHQKPTLPLTFEKPRPIYLFICPPPMSISELISWSKGHTRTHFWSFDENGQSEMTEEECRQRGVPVLVPSIGAYTHTYLNSWPTTVYTTLRQWQAACGFDLTTADWARSCGYPELEIISRKNDEARFEEFHKNTPWEYLWKQETKSRSWWPWSWEAVTGSGISACM